ncbi:CHASE2 domain-containing protein [Acidovorax sp. 28-64-14]|uniref:CHASE2 domain-containing protein n=1 Tax=Acidovorax sp. 28-64-14 TaxID=1970310 RepID=UPI0025B80C91|nr:CHASE2 domain-containing protein [Acidovorax sp. 28-64-14]
MSVADSERPPHPTRRWALALWLVLLALLSAGLVAIGALRKVDHSWHDAVTPLLAVQAAPESVTIIDIDERSLQEVGPWPWPRPVLAQLAQQLRDKGARLQVWDLFFSQAGPADAEFGRQLQQPDIVIGQIPVLDPQVLVAPQEGQLVADAHAPLLCSRHQPVHGYLGVAPGLAPAHVGHLSATPDSDGPLRRLPAVLCLPSEIAAKTEQATRTGGAGEAAAMRRIPQITLAAAAADTPDQPWNLEPGNFLFGPQQWLHRGPWKFALDAQGYLPIPYQRPHGAWHAISASQVLDPDASIPSLRNQIVLVGGTALGLSDVVSTPYHPNAPGVSVHAELLAAGLQAQTWTAIVPRGATLLAAVSTVLAAWLLLPLAQPRRRIGALVAGVCVGMLIPLALSLLGRLAGLMLPVAAPLLALMLHGLAITGLQRWVGHVDSLQGLALIHALHSAASAESRTHGGQLEHAQGDVFYMSWPSNDANATATALDGLRQLRKTLAPILERNASEGYPLSFYAALESGAYLLGLVGAAGARRSVLLGPVANDVAGMLALCEELDSPILIGPQAAQTLTTQVQQHLQSLGQFILPDQLCAKTLYRVPL